MVKEENQFVGDVQDLLDSAYNRWELQFTVTACVYNVHMLSHLQRYYDLLGPLANWSALPFESAYSMIREVNFNQKNPCKQVLQQMYKDYELEEHKQ